ncbi:DUF4440 domain-containing protein [Ornithinimicrobium pratense]|uniref:Nuclear transport factor 2 family protein n=1 Tax=Ornithinimicrobium pratense TaxID=2593973 RepID=A0A5J6V1N1_9MICO|nr:nuclear transport factor 2 family protein [Ornithinimicrobium pratense]QFG67515.1 nuclear transport factor 2 family protein [Ornithinimicrobium pratense]
MRTIDDDLRCVLELERELQSPSTRGDADRLRKLLSPTFIEIGASGRRWDRRSILDLLVQETADPSTAGIRIDNLTGRQLTEDMIQVFWDSTRKDRRARRTSLWQRRDGRWQLIYHQATVLP